MKKRIITLVLSALAVVLLVGVGFASWVVSQGAESNQTGNILVETVKDERLAVSVTPDGKSFQFGAPEGASASGKWLFEDNDHAVPENLEVSFTVVVTRPTAFELDANDQPDGLSLTATLGSKILASASDTTGVDFPAAFFSPAAVATRYGVNAENNDTLWTMSNNDMTATTTVVVELQWGSLFNYENPYDYFNALAVDGAVADTSAAEAAGLTLPANPTWGDLAVAALEAVYDYNSYLFQLKIEVEVA